MANNVHKFRRVKWGNPREKLKVLAEDIPRPFWMDRLAPRQFVLFVCVVSVAVFVIAAAAVLALGG